MKKRPVSILERFPGKRRMLTQRMVANAEFYELCCDYEICVKALQYWARSGDPEARTRIAEYRSLVRRLEDEIAAELKSSEMRPED